MPEYKRANMMVCNVYNALECVGCINNTVARLLLALTEMQRDPTDSTSSSVSHNHRCDESLGLRIQIRSQVCLTHIPLPEPGENTVQQLLLVLDRSSVYTPRRPELLEKQAKKYKATDYLYPFQAVRSFIPSWVLKRSTATQDAAYWLSFCTQDDHKGLGSCLEPVQCLGLRVLPYLEGRLLCREFQLQIMSQIELLISPLHTGQDISMKLGACAM